MWKSLFEGLGLGVIVRSLVPVCLACAVGVGSYYFVASQSAESDDNAATNGSSKKSTDAPTLSLAAKDSATLSVNDFLTISLAKADYGDWRVYAQSGCSFDAYVDENRRKIVVVPRDTGTYMVTCAVVHKGAPVGLGIPLFVSGGKKQEVDPTPIPPVPPDVPPVPPTPVPPTPTPEPTDLGSWIIQKCAEIVQSAEPAARTKQAKAVANSYDSCADGADGVLNVNNLLTCPANKNLTALLNADVDSKVLAEWKIFLDTMTAKVYKDLGEEGLQDKEKVADVYRTIAEALKQI